MHQSRGFIRVLFDWIMDKFATLPSRIEKKKNLLQYSLDLIYFNWEFKNDSFGVNLNFFFFQSIKSIRWPGMPVKQ